MTALSGLETIDWASLSHAYGAAVDVPRCIRDLASEDAGTREEAIDALFSNIWHQGTVYEASAHAVPFLVELAADEQVASREMILSLLGALARGSSYLDAHDRAGLLFNYDRREPEFSTRRSTELAWVRSTHEAVAGAAEQYELLLARDPVPAVRAAAAYVLGRLPERKALTASMLLDAYEREPDLLARTALLWALGGLGDASPATLALLRRAAAAADPREQFAAAVSFVRLGGSADDPAPRPVLSRFAATPWFRERCLALPWDWSAEVDLRDLFEPIPPAEKAEAVGMLAAVLPELTADRSAPVVYDLLHLAFGAHKWRRPERPLAPLQRRALELALSATAWQAPHRLQFLDDARKAKVSPARMAEIRREMSDALGPAGKDVTR